VGKGELMAATPSTAKPWTVPSYAAPVLRRFRSAQALSWLDQGLVSATNFLCLYLIARWGSAAEVGAFAMAMSIVALFLAAQEALVVRPYSLQLGQSGSNHHQTAQALCVTYGLCSLSFCFILAGAIVFAWRGSPESIAYACLALALAAPCILLREFARKHSYAHLRLDGALSVTGAACILTLFALLTLGLAQELTAANAIGVLGAASLLSFIVWAYRGEALHRLKVEGAWRQSWRLGKWFLAAQSAVQAQAYATIWIVLALVGPASTGIYATCASVVGLANPLLYGVLNLLVPQSSQVLRDGGVTALRKLALQSALLITGIMTVFCLVLTVGGEWVMSLAFPLEYHGQRWTLVLLAAAMLAGAAGAPASIALGAANHASVAAWLIGGTALTNILCVIALLPSAGLIGAALAALISEVVGCAARWSAFLMLVRDTPEVKRQPKAGPDHAP
jgi:O-antigen/teichoic acid export membrane protein